MKVSYVTKKVRFYLEERNEEKLNEVIDVANVLIRRIDELSNRLARIEHT